MGHNELGWKGVEHIALTWDVEMWWGSYEYGNKPSGLM